MIENESSINFINNEINNDGPKLNAIVKKGETFYPDVYAESDLTEMRIE